MKYEVQFISLDGAYFSIICDSPGTVVNHILLVYGNVSITIKPRKEGKYVG